MSSNPANGVETGESFLNAGREIGQIPVRISYRIIELFSDGLYSTPTKAIEELVSNSFDAGAGNVHVVLSPDRVADDAIIVVVDDGESMDESGFRQHWLIGHSSKRGLAKLPRGRKQIGKFGIGKLATFVLAENLTHVCKRGSRFFAATMDYRRIPQGKGGSVEFEGREVLLPLRELTAQDARACLPLLVFGTKPGFKAIDLFGENAPRSWTVAIMSSLKPLAKQIQMGRLEWVLKTAMPMRKDFRLFLDGDWLRPTKFDQTPLKTWVIGKDLSGQCEEVSGLGLKRSLSSKGPPQHKYGLVHPSLGRITGFVEVYQEILTEHIDRSHGFFVYVRERLINPYESHFGIPANSLRHGTFSRFRMVVHIDSLDEELRSSRETIRDTQLKSLAQKFLIAVFNLVRNYLQQLDESQTPGFRAAMRIKQTPGSLTYRPVVGLVESGMAGKSSPRLLRFPKDLSNSNALPR